MPLAVPWDHAWSVACVGAAARVKLCAISHAGGWCAAGAVQMDRARVDAWPEPGRTGSAVRRSIPMRRLTAVASSMRGPRSPLNTACTSLHSDRSDCRAPVNVRLCSKVTAYGYIQIWAIDRNREERKSYLRTESNTEKRKLAQSIASRHAAVAGSA